MTVINSPAGIEGVRLAVLKGRIKLEIKGIRFKGRPTTAIVRDKFGFRGNKRQVLEQLESYIEKFNREHGFANREEPTRKHGQDEDESKRS